MYSEKIIRIYTDIYKYIMNFNKIIIKDYLLLTA